MKQIKVEKRDGRLENYNVEKIHKVLGWATEGLDNVSISDIEMNAKLNLSDKVSTEKIHKSLIKAADNLTTLENSDYQYVAARLLSYWLRKNVWGSSEPPRLYDIINKNISIGVYDSYITEHYSESEIHKIGKLIKHDRDDTLTYAGIQQFLDKYLIKDRGTGKVYETPQFAYMLIAMCFFAKYPREKRFEYVKKAYNYFSTYKINLPTPIIAGVRSKIRQFASCTLFDCGDSLDSIFATVSAVGKYSAKRAGIGLNVGRIRPINSFIRQNEVIHTGVLPFTKIFESTVKSTSQNGIRGASATVYYPFWNAEVLDVIQLKNNAGTDENRIRKMDYCIQFTKLFYDRLIKNQEITLFSPNECPELYDNFGLPNFEELYLKREADTNIRIKHKIKAIELMEILARERFETGRIYVMNIDTANYHNPFSDRVTMSNLCVSGDTLLLTSDGYHTISELNGKNVEVWNGKQFSKTTVVKTGVGKKLFRVYLSDNSYLDCTGYHKWYTVDSYSKQRDGKYTEKRTLELNIGDKLIKLETPVIDTGLDFKYPYTHGFFCADGTYENKEKNKARISLYGSKIELLNFLDVKTDRGYDSFGRYNVTLPNDISEKYFVPINYSVKSKILWLSGFLDGDGAVVLSDNNYSIQAASINLDFLREIKLMLQTLGVQSKISDCQAAGTRLMPDGMGGQKEYICKKTYRILISSVGLSKLIDLGLDCHRLKLLAKKPQRAASHFVTVVSVNEIDGVHDTYCVSEPYEHKAVFNGIITGNCTEIIHPTKPISSLDDKEGEIGTCILSAINLVETKKNEIPDVCDVIVRMLDELIDYQEYAVYAAEKFTKERRSLGIGMTNLASLFAQNKLEYGSEGSLKLLHSYVEHIQYYLLVASNNLAKERGTCAKYQDTKYSNGWLPIDTYCKEVDNIVGKELELNWEELRNNIKEYGLLHSSLTAQMPCESCLKWDTLLVTELGNKDFHDICNYGDIDWRHIENNNSVGWYNLSKPINIKTKDSYIECDKIYYNGYVDTYDITLDNGNVIKATPNHRFLVKNDTGTIWKRVYELLENDDIVEIK